MSRPRILCLSGFDPRGAAGLLRDAWAVERAGGEPLGVVTALTLQNRANFLGAMPPPSGSVIGALRALAEELHPDAIKIGLVVTPATIVEARPLLTQWAREGIPIVVDPVQAPSAGGYAASGELRAALYEWLGPLGAHWTPNRPELTWLGDHPKYLLERGAASVLVKGGHGRVANEVVDELFTKGGHLGLGHPRRRGVGKRGTGCTLASLLAVELARGRTIEAAARNASRKLQELWDELLDASI